MRYIAFLFIWIASCNLTVNAQQEEVPVDSNAVVTNSFWDNWYGQLGVDMNLLFPEGHNMADVFPNGKSFGVNVAVGKWFSPEFGGRFKLTWNNGILKNEHNTWLAPYGEAGENHREGGFITFLGDINFNLHNLFGNYRPERKWNIIVAPRAGGYLNIGKGHIGRAHVLGIGVINTYQLNDRWRLFADVGYHFVSSINGVSSGTGHGSNGFAEIAIGIETDLSKKNTFHKALAQNIPNKRSVIVNSFWDNWFGQVGIGMSLQNIYGANFFSGVFPNGSTFGVNLGFGKWFTPEAGVRLGMNWQNGLLINHHATYLQPRSDSEGDPSKHSFISVYADMFFNLHNAIAGYDAQRKWNTIIYPRMGLAKNFSSEYEECPIVGIGTEQTYKLNNKIKVFADLSYQFVTGGFWDGKFDTGGGCDSNGWFDINVGIQYEFGKNWWEKPSEKHHLSQWEGGHNWPRFIVNTGASVIVAFGAKTALKTMIKEERPDHSDDKSFPSGHASMAFAAARSIDKEFRKDCIWIPIAGYAAATAVGIERIASDRHHWYDVVAGAAVGYGAAELTWWLSDKMFGKGSNIAVGSSGNSVDVAVTW